MDVEYFHRVCMSLQSKSGRCADRLSCRADAVLQAIYFGPSTWAFLFVWMDPALASDVGYPSLEQLGFRMFLGPVYIFKVGDWSNIPSWSNNCYIDHRSILARWPCWIDHGRITAWGYRQLSTVRTLVLKNLEVPGCFTPWSGSWWSSSMLGNVGWIESGSRLCQFWETKQSQKKWIIYFWEMVME